MKKTNKKLNKKALAFILCTVAVLAVVICAGSKTALKKLYPLGYTEYVEKYSEQYGVPKELLYATIKVESGYDEHAKSEVGALGLTQIMPDTLSWLCSKTGESYTEEDLYNPEISIKYCAYFYSLLLEKYGTRDEAICAYHAGINQVAKWLENPEYSSDGKTLDRVPSKVTGQYLHKVTRAIEIYKSLYEKEFENE